MTNSRSPRLSLFTAIFGGGGAERVMIEIESIWYPERVIIALFLRYLQASFFTRVRPLA